MASTRKAFILGGGAITLAALGLVIPRAVRHDDKAARGAPRAAATLTAQAVSRAAGSRQWPAGSAFVYAVESERVLSISDGAPKGPLASTITGRLAVAVVEAGPSGVRLRLELRAPRHGDAPGRALDDAELARAFYADAAPDGHLQAFSFQGGVSARARTELKALASALQIVDAPAAGTWRATEVDGAGEYVASYRRTGNAIHKSKERYQRLAGSRGLTAPPEGVTLTVSSSSADFTLTPSGWPETASSDETLEAKAGALRLSGRTRTKATLVAVEPVPDLAAEVAAEAGSLAGDAPDTEGLADARRRAEENRVRGASYETLVGDLRSADVHTQNHAMGRTAALFRLRPEEAAKAADTVLRGDLDEGATGRLLGALGGAGTKEAQGALSTVLASSAPPETRAAAAASLGMTQEPTEESEYALVSAMASPDPSVASTATLGAGNLIKRMNAAGSGDTSAAAEALIARLNDATTDDERKLCLQALGNTGDAGALGTIEQYLTYANPVVRAAAVFALRFIAGDGADGDLTAAMKDPDVTVRRAAVSTLRFRSITPILGAVDGLLRSDPDVTLRIGIVAAMQIRRREDTAVTASLQWAAVHDPSAEVQKAAKSALAG